MTIYRGRLGTVVGDRFMGSFHLTAPACSRILASLTRNYPFLSGCGTLANHRLMKLLTPGSSESLFWAGSPGGDLQISLGDYVGRAVYFFGDLDPKITWIAKQLLKPGDTALDIGANIGLLTLWMAKLVGAQGAVHGFEPNPILCRMIKAAIIRNGAENTQLHAIALGAQFGEMELRVP